MNRPTVNSFLFPSVRAFAAATGAAFALAACSGPEAPAPARPGAAPLASVEVTAGPVSGLSGYEGEVQAIRQTVLSAQVAGAVVALEVKAGDRVRAGQLLARIDARAAEQSAAAGAAQAQAAREQLVIAERDFQRQRQLYERQFISQAALDRYETQYKSARAEAAAQIASAGAARTQTDFHVLRAPYDGVVSEVSVVLGDMAMPGRPLLTLHDPAAMRVSAHLPQTVAAALADAGDALSAVELPSARGTRIAPLRMQLLPAVDPSTRTQELRLDLPRDTAVAPGAFARVWIVAAPSAAQARVFVPSQAVLRRGEVTAVYVLDAQGLPLLRQVRLGRAEGERVEVLAGVSAGERVATDPAAAAASR